MRPRFPIESVKARKVFDSRGEPTIEVDVRTPQGLGRVAAPSGKSRGKLEAEPFPEGGVAQAIREVERRVAPRIVGMDASEQAAIDQALHESDGTERFSQIGGNAAFAVSLATALAAANSAGIPLFQHLAPQERCRISLPLGNVVGGGMHALGRRPDFQEFLVVPTKAVSFAQAAEVNVRAHSEISKVMARAGVSTIGKGDEGAWIVDMKTEQILDVVGEAAEVVGNQMNITVRVGVDVAASTLWDEATKSYSYRRDGKQLDRDEQMRFILELIDRHQLLYVEDPFRDDDFEAFTELRKEAPGVLVCGDDLLVTNAERIERAVKRNAANAVIIKTNQVGTLSDARRAAEIAASAGCLTVMSHRSGEAPTGEIAHLAVAFECPLIKCGAVGGERIAKVNELIRIEEYLRDKAAIADIGM